MFDFDIAYNPTGWGPVLGEKLTAFDEVPYAHFDKKEKLGKAADFTLSHSFHTKSRFPRRDETFNADFTYRHDSTEDSTFQLVDTPKLKVTKRTYNPKALPTSGRGSSLPNRVPTRPGRSEPIAYGKLPGRKAASKFAWKGSSANPRFRRDFKIDRAPSLTVEGDWEVIEEFDLNQLLKLAANSPVTEDLMWCGQLDTYDQSYDQVSTRAPRSLRKFENKLFFSETAQNDPVLHSKFAEGVGDVFATDLVLGMLMACPRSVYSWDIVIEKTEGKVFLDSRDGTLELLSVSETAQTPPSSEDPDDINSPQKLSAEASTIAQNFSQQILLDAEGSRLKYPSPNPFFDPTSSEGGDPASVAYRYRMFTLGNIKLVARCELHGRIVKGTQESLMTCFALNEWDCKTSGGMNWRQKIDQQRGAVLATELKNNSCKLARWTAQSLLAGTDLMKIGYVSRVAPNNPIDHAILATQVFKPREFAQQINLGLNNIWGIVKMICELLLSKEDGKYVLMKDPLKPIIRLYSVPLDTFEEKDEREEKGEDDEAN